MGNRRQHPILRTALYGAAMLSGLVFAFIVMLNLHITVGLEEGYAASPAQVWGFSPLLTAADVVLLVGGPLLGLYAAHRIHRRNSSDPDRDGRTLLRGTPR